LQRTHVREKIIEYDGSQLSPLWAYRSLGVAGDSIVSFRGPCDVSLEHMVDAEDLRNGSSISSPEMLHFIVELFGATMTEIVLAQRLLLVSAAERLRGTAGPGVELERRFDNIYGLAPEDTDWRKLSVSVASLSPVSGMIHLGLNVEGAGAPVRAVGLHDIGIEDIDDFAEKVGEAFLGEIENVEADACKVRPLD
jgi:hypothetical protein